MALITENISLQAITVLNGETCAKGCAERDECVFAAVSNIGNESNPSLYVNDQGGQHDGWTETDLSTWTTEDPTDIAGAQDFIFIVNGAETLPLARSMDRGTTIAYLSGSTDMGTNNPFAADLITPDFIIVVGANGYVWVSDDYGTTWQTVSAGGATSENLTEVMICRDNPSVVYAVGANNAIIKSRDGGYSWFALTGPSATDALSALEVIAENELLVGNDDGELWQTTDGGNTWTEQAELPSLPASAAINAISCCACGSVEKHGACYLIVEDTAASEHIVLRNAGFGSAQWETEEGFTSLSLIPQDIVCCNNNRALVVGGDESNSGFTGLIS